MGYIFFHICILIFNFATENCCVVKYATPIKNYGRKVLKKIFLLDYQHQRQRKSQSLCDRPEVIHSYHNKTTINVKFNIAAYIRKMNGGVQGISDEERFRNKK